MQNTATVFVCTNEAIYGLGLKAGLEETGFSVLAITASLFPAVTELKPDLILLDSTLDQVALETLRALRLSVPDSRIVVWTHTATADRLARLLEAGVLGILHRSATVESLAACLRSAANGQRWVDPETESKLVELRKPRLNRRDEELVRLVTAGQSNREIAAELSLTEGTVKVYLSKLLRKLAVGDRLDVATYGVRQMGLPIPSYRPRRMEWAS